MNLEETAKLLTLAAGFDNRRVDEVTIHAWREALRDVPYQVASQGVLAHVKGPRRHEYLTVAHVIDYAETGKRSRRIEVEADIRSAKARRLIGSEWPDREPLPADVAEGLAAAREADRVQAVKLSLELES